MTIAFALGRSHPGTLDLTNITKNMRIDILVERRRLQYLPPFP